MLIEQSNFYVIFYDKNYEKMNDAYKLILKY